jgi:hypothetical protein
VDQESEVHYRLVPNNTRVYGYGRREYIVTTIVDEQSYYCECCKFDRDGMLCCHILKVFVTLGIKIIPDNYILERWAQEPLVATTGGGDAANMFVQPDLVARGMPLSGRRTLWFTNLSKAFADLAANGCMSIKAYKTMQDHIKIMRSKLNVLKKKRKACKQVSSAAVPAYAPSTSTPVVGVAGAAADSPAPAGSCVDHVDCLSICVKKCRF